jgi:acetyltransferase-like isoleucine patch superfamily enzyme
MDRRRSRSIHGGRNPLTSPRRLLTSFAEKVMVIHQITHPAQQEDMLKFARRMRNKLHTMWLRQTYPFAAMGESVSIDYSCPISRRHAHRISLGNQVRLARDAYVGVSGPAHGAGEPVIIIEDNSVVHWRSMIGGRNRIHIERDCIITQDVLITDHDHLFEDVTKPVDNVGYTEGGTIRIGEGSWVGHGAAIICSRGELVLGRHCVIAANAVVTRSAPPFSVLSGNPARVVKQYDPAKKAWVLGSARAGESQAVEAGANH